MSEMQRAELAQLERQYRLLEQQWRSLDAQLQPQLRELAQLEALLEEVKWEWLRLRDRIAGRGVERDERTDA